MKAREFEALSHETEPAAGLDDGEWPFGLGVNPVVGGFVCGCETDDWAIGIDGPPVQTGSGESR